MNYDPEKSRRVSVPLNRLSSPTNPAVAAETQPLHCLRNRSCQKVETVTLSPPLRVLIVDDSVIYRKVIRDALMQIDGVEVVGTASDGQVAIDFLRHTPVDLVTLDLEMPHVDGLGVLEHLQEHHPDMISIMLSAHTELGAARTLQALDRGAFDFILKPAGINPETNAEQLLRELRLKVHAAQHRRRSSAMESTSSIMRPKHQSQEPGLGQLGARTASLPPKIVVIGISTGGPAALSKLLPALPEKFPVPILIVQHMPPLFTKSLAEDLNRLSKLEIQEAVDNELVRPGQVRIAPGGKQMKIRRRNDYPQIIITDDPPVRSCRPSVDYLFTSTAETYHASTLGIVMTGMGDDGTAGCQAIRDQGGQVFAQDEASCVVYGMPKSVVQAGFANRICGLNDLSQAILQTVSRGAMICR